ncbi:hypothetical protein DFH11DRAFT_1725808 [Phellopilus nigrolimitatus]|nr:hypothetical protein DFH11DRAFT_1725808 [Phellopilus nigrolimitatus]
MEAASTLPGLKDLFPEHFFQQLNQTGSPSQLGSVLPQSPALSQATSSSRQHEMQHFNQQQPHPEQMIFPHTYQHPNYSAGSHTMKPSYDGGQQEGYMFAPDMGMGPGVHNSGGMSMGGGGVGPGGFGGGARTDGDDDGMDDGEDGDGDEAEDDFGTEKRRHSCSQCGKRFNRPSSLKIHLNTHTGAKPFACPHPGCGRSFNVSSNMRRHYRNHARRSAPAPLPSSSYPIPYTKSTRGRPAQSYRQQQQQQQPANGQHVSENPNGYGQPQMYHGGGPTHAQLYPRKSDMRTRTGSHGQSVGSGVGGHPPTPPYTEESEFGGAEHERGNEGEYPYGGGYDSGGGYEGAPGPFSGPYGGFGAGPPGPLYAANALQQQQSSLHAGMQVPIVEMAFPVDPMLDPNLGGDQDADAEGEVDPDADAEGEAVDAEGDDDAEGEMEGEELGNGAGAPLCVTDIGSGGHGPKGLRWRRPASANSPSSPVKAKGRGKGTPQAPAGLQFRQILVPMGDPAQYAQYQEHYAQYGYPYPFPVQAPVNGSLNGNGAASNGSPGGTPYPPPGYVAYPAMYAYAAPQQGHATSAMRTSGVSASLKAKAGVKDAAKPSAKEPEKEENEKPNPRTLPQSNARASARRPSVEGAIPGTVPDPPYPMYTYPPPSQPQSTALERGAAKMEGEGVEKKGEEPEMKESGKRTRVLSSKAASLVESEPASLPSPESEDDADAEEDGDDGDDDDDDYLDAKKRRASKKAGKPSPRKRQKGAPPTHGRSTRASAAAAAAVTTA